ncbi:MAG: hypothetical protein H0T51_22745 [Pirellulales bacterium]|nr:hypothetical protein [Pirellulales bacterium]
MKTNQLVVCTVFAAAVLSLAGSSALAQPVLRYTFDEATGAALDTGTAPLTDATLEGGAVRSADTPSGSGMSLDMRVDGPHAHLLGSDASDVDGLAALTLTTWLKVQTYLDATSNNKRLVSKQAATATFDGFTFNMNASRIDAGIDPPVGPDSIRLGLFLGGDLGFASALSDAYVDATQWIFLAATYDSQTAEINYYTGGVSTPVTQLGTTQTLALNPNIIDGMDARVAVGLTDAAPTADTSVTGWQDDVRVYSSALDLAALDAVRLENLGGGGGNPADFDNDGDVDGLDLAEWKMGFGTTGTAVKGDGDADADMDVDGADFLVWQQELGSSGASAIAAIPEPATSLLVALAIAACSAAVRRSK